MSFVKAALEDKFDGTERLRCQAHGCPNNWSVDMGAKLCSKHAWSDSRDWGLVTQKITTPKLLRRSPVKPHTEVDLEL